jgi:hypothetical protein
MHKASGASGVANRCDAKTKCSKILTQIFFSKLHESVIENLITSGHGVSPTAKIDVSITLFKS